MCNDDTCSECGDPLKMDQDWIIKDTDLLGTEATGPWSESYIHRECASDEHVRSVYAEADP
jgi:hypothetical protein